MRTRLEPTMASVRRLAGALGILLVGPSTASASEPIRFRAIDISAGMSCGIDVEGVAWCWGRPAMGDGSARANSDSDVPVRVYGDRTFADIATGDHYALALDPSGAGFGWGSNGFAQLGNGQMSSRLYKTTPSPMKGSVRMSRIAARGDFGACGLDDEGRLYCWGGPEDPGPMLGIGPGPMSRTPQAWLPKRRFGHVDISGRRMCAVTTGGDALCWGNGNNHTFGNGEAGVHASPTPVAGDHTWSTVDLGYGHACGLDTDGRAWCWGRDTFGSLGHEGAEEGCKGLPGFSTCTPTPMPVQTDQRFVQLEVGENTNCGLDQKGQVWCWGSGRYGMLGDGDTAKHERASVEKVDTNVSFASIVLEGDRACGLDAKGLAWCWGGSANPGRSSGVPIPVPPPG